MKDSSHYWMKGIYLIRIGRLRYIGKALCIGDRLYDHQVGINKAMKNYSRYVNIGFKDKDERSRAVSYLRIAKYLLENPSIEAGSVEVIQRGVCSNKMWFSEIGHLQDVKNHPDYYNISWAGSRPRWDEYHQWDVVEKEGQLEFFDLRIPHVRVKSGNTPARNKEAINKINEIKKEKQFRIARVKEVYDRFKLTNPSVKDQLAAVTAVSKKILEITRS